MGILEKRKELKKLQVPPSRTKAILAKCKECMAGYIDGRFDCEMPDCPLYYWMPYRNELADLRWAKKGKENVEHSTETPQEGSDSPTPTPSK